MKKYLLLVVCFLLVLIPVFSFAEENYTDWVGKEIIFLPQYPSSQHFGYQDYVYKLGSYKPIPYKDLVNKTAILLSIENDNGTLKAIFKTENGITIYGTGYGGNLDGIGFKSELESAKKYIGQSIQQRENTQYPISFYIINQATGEPEKAEVPQQEKLSVENVGWGYNSYSPLQFTLKRTNGDLVFWNGSYSRINDTSNHLMNPFDESWISVDSSITAESSQAPKPSGNDYSNVKGDFKVLVLGDTKEIVKEKLDYLVSKDEASLKYKSSYEFFIAKILNDDVEGYLEYFQNKLYKITLTFPEYLADHIDTDIKSSIENNIKPMFVKLYGKPTVTYEFPNILKLKDGYMAYCYKWVLNKKTICVGVSAYKFKYNAEIIIIDNGLDKEKQKIDSNQKQQSQDKSQNDF